MSIYTPKFSRAARSNLVANSPIRQFRPFSGLARDLEIGHKLPQFCEVLRGKYFTVCNICTQETLHSWNKWRHMKEMLLAFAFSLHTRTLTVPNRWRRSCMSDECPECPECPVSLGNISDSLAYFALWHMLHLKPKRVAYFGKSLAYAQLKTKKPWNPIYMESRRTSVG